MLMASDPKLPQSHRIAKSIKISSRSKLTPGALVKAGWSLSLEVKDSPDPSVARLNRAVYFVVIVLVGAPLLVLPSTFLFP